MILVCNPFWLTLGLNSVPENSALQTPSCVLEFFHFKNNVSRGVLAATQLLDMLENTPSILISLPYN